MTELTEAQQAWLDRIANTGNGTWPDRPFLRSAEAVALMRMGLVEAIKPSSPYLAYVAITPAGRVALEEAEDG